MQIKKHNNRYKLYLDKYKNKKEFSILEKNILDKLDYITEQRKLLSKSIGGILSRCSDVNKYITTILFHYDQDKSIYRPTKYMCETISIEDANEFINNLEIVNEIDQFTKLISDYVLEAVEKHNNTIYKRIKKYYCENSYFLKLLKN